MIDFWPYITHENIFLISDLWCAELYIMSQNLSMQNKHEFETLLHQANIVKNRIYKFYRKNSTHCVRGWTLVRSSLIPTNNIHLFIAPTKKKKDKWYRISKEPYMVWLHTIKRFFWFAFLAGSICLFRCQILHIKVF